MRLPKSDSFHEKFSQLFPSFLMKRSLSNQRSILRGKFQTVVDYCDCSFVMTVNLTSLVKSILMIFPSGALSSFYVITLYSRYFTLV